MVKRLTQSFTYAGRGLYQTWCNEMNFRIEVTVTIIVLLLGWWLDFDTTKMVILILTCGFVLALEVVNTMIERISDLLKPRLDHYVRQIKDLSSGAVLIAAGTAIGVALFLLVPPLWALLSWQA